MVRFEARLELRREQLMASHTSGAAWGDHHGNCSWASRLGQVTCVRNVGGGGSISSCCGPRSTKDVFEGLRWGQDVADLTGWMQHDNQHCPP